jgi:hypothetical protein
VAAAPARWLRPRPGGLTLAHEPPTTEGTGAAPAALLGLGALVLIEKLA